MKTLEQAAKDYVKTTIHFEKMKEGYTFCDIERAFYAGVNYVERLWREKTKWISTQDGLPQKDKDVILKWDNSAGRYNPKILIGSLKNNNKFYNQSCELLDSATRKVTHWRPIEIE